jgi:hypothetical protein
MRALLRLNGLSKRLLIFHTKVDIQGCATRLHYLSRAALEVSTVCEAPETSE